MKKYIAFIVVFFMIPFYIFSQFNSSYKISDVYIEMDTGYTTYYAEIEDTSSYLTSPKFGEVKNLYKKANISDIGYGKFVVQIEHISGDLYKIVGTSFVIEMMFASSYAFSGYGDYILDTTTFGGSVTKKE